MSTSYNRRDGRDNDADRLQTLLGVLAFVLVVLAFALVGRADYEDRCAALAPASTQEVQASCVTSR